MTDEIQQNRWDRMVRRVAGIVGPGSKVSEVITEMFPMINLEEPPSELLLLGGTVLGMGASDITAAVAETPKIQVFNPVGSGTIVTVTDVWFSSLTTSVTSFAREATPRASGIGTQVARDTRQNPTSLPTCQMFQESSVGFANGNMIFRQLASSTLHIRGDNDVMVLGPGTGLTVNNRGTNGRLICTFLWRERPAEPSELQF